MNFMMVTNRDQGNCYYWLFFISKATHRRERMNEVLITPAISRRVSTNRKILDFLPHPNSRIEGGEK